MCWEEDFEWVRIRGKEAEEAGGGELLKQKMVFVIKQATEDAMAAKAITKNLETRSCVHGYS